MFDLINDKRVRNLKVNGSTATFNLPCMQLHAILSQYKVKYGEYKIVDILPGGYYAAICGKF